MQTFSPEFQAELDKGRTDPRVLVDVYEFYSADYVPGVDGFDPADAIETFAGQNLTWNGIAYRREVISRGDIVLNVGEQTNSVSIQFSNISRYLATFAQSQTIEGMLLCIRCIAPAVTNDSKAMFHGRCDKPGDITKKSFPLTARQDFGNINQTLPPRKFTADDPAGRLPGDDLYEGIQFVAVSGTYNYPFVQPSTSFVGRLLGRRRTVNKTEQFSSIDNTPYGSVVPEIFGRCQMELIPFISIDKGIFIAALWAISSGPISAAENIKTRAAGLSDPINSFATPPAPAIVHLGDLGGTGTNTGNTGQADLGGGSKFSHLAYVEGAIVPTEYFQNPSLSDPNVLNELPTVTALVLGRRVELPDGTGSYVLEGFTVNPVHIARFILTNPSFVNINSGFMEDAVNYLTGLHCDEPLLDDSQLIVVNSVDQAQAGSTFTRNRSTGLITPSSILDGAEIAETLDGPYISYSSDDIDPGICPIGQHRDPATGECVDDLPDPVVNATQPLLRKRYTVNVPITAEVRAVDFLYKTIFPAAKLFMRVNKYGRYEIRSEQPSDATRLRSATAVGATSIPILDATPWKSGPDLLKGRLLLGVGLETAEVRNISTADYSTAGNSISLSASSTGGVTATASGATLSGGSTSAQASGTLTIGGSPAANDTVTITIDGVAVGYILGADDTTESAATMLTGYINATRKLAQYISAEQSGSVITIKCKYGVLNVDSAFLKTHGGPIANPTSAPTLAASAGSLDAGDYQVAYADVNTIGLTALTPVATITLTDDQQIDVSFLPAFPSGVTSRQFFVSEKIGSTQLRYQATRTDASDFSINALPLPNAALPPAINTTAEELIRVALSFATNSQDVFPMRKPLTAVVLNDIYLPDPLNGHKYQNTAATTGITGSGAVTWPTSVGGTVVDGGVTWTEIGSTVLQQAGLTRANVIKDTYRWPLGSQQSSVNQIKGSYRDAKNDFALTPFRVNDPVHQAQVKKIYPLEFDGSAIDNPHQFFRIASWLLSKNREGDWFNALETGPHGLALEEGDVICASDDSGGLVNVPTRIEEIRIKPNHEVSITSARKYSTTMYSDDVGSHVIPIASTLRYVATLDSVIEFLDIPAIRPEDGSIPGFYVSVTRDLSLDGDWRGWSLHADYGDGYKQIAQGNVPATLGASTTTLADVADTSVLDTTNELTFTLDYIAASNPFVDATEAELLANPRRNLFLIGSELIQAGTIVDNGGRSFTVSDLFHGRFETSCVSHSIGERVVYLDSAEVFVPIALSRIDIEYDYKAVTTNQDVSEATAIPFTWSGDGIRPVLITDPVVSIDGFGDFLIQFIGHPRQSEIPENYTVEVWDTDFANLKGTLPVTIGSTHAVLLNATDKSTGTGGAVTSEGGGETLISAHPDKNNLFGYQEHFGGGATNDASAVSMEALSETWQRFDFTLQWLGDDHPDLNPLDTTLTAVAALQTRSDTDPVSDVFVPDLSVSPLSVEWSDSGTPGIVTETYKSFGVTIGSRNVDLGYGSGMGIGDLVVSRSGSRYSFLLAGNEYQLHENFTGATGKTPLAKVSAGDGFAFPLRFTAHVYTTSDVYLTASIACLNIVAGGALQPSTVFAVRDQIAMFGSQQSRVYLKIYQNGNGGLPDGNPVEVIAPPL